MDIVPVLVAYHSVDWIRVAVESYLQQFPEDRLLVIDNNPKRGERSWLPDCERERHWLAAHPGVILVENPAPPDGLLHNRSHGAGLDLALAWCQRRGGRVLVHLEPDCLITSRQWRDNLLAALDRGAWMAGSVRQCHGPIHPTPSAWLVEQVRASFTITPWKGRDANHPRFTELVDVASLAKDNSPMGVWIGWTHYWDTCHKAWFEAALHERTALVETPGFTHYWHGSQQLRMAEHLLATRYPEIVPYLEQARARTQPLPLEQCVYRDRVHQEAGNETACCRLLQQVSSVQAVELCSVSRDACQACRASWEPSPRAPNPVVASLLYRLAEQICQQGGVPGCSAARAARLQRWAEKNLNVELT